jgi:hypothetical protein
MKTRILLAMSLFLLFAVSTVVAQPTASMTLKVNIDFPFTVEGKVLPAGDYQFMRDDTGMAFRVQGKGKVGALAMIVTRLGGEMHTTPKDSHLVFDKIGDKYLLSEIWLPNEDGYLLLATKGKHEHKTLNVE